MHRVVGCYVAWRLRKQSKLEWLSSNRTQKGQETLHQDVLAQTSRFLRHQHGSEANDVLGFPLALNFIASGECLRHV